jgi:hypothetical protein
VDARRIAIETLAIGAVIGGIWWRWWAVQNAVPEIAIPAVPPAPAVNGYDVLAHALAASAAQAAAGHDERYYDRETAAVPTEAGREAIVRDNAAAIGAIHQVLALAWQSPVPQTTGDSRPFMLYAGIRNALRNCALAGDVKAAHSDVSGALQVWGDTMQFGAEVVPSGRAGFYRMGIACESIGRQRFWSIAGSLSAADARAAALRVERIDDQRVPLTVAMTNGKWSTESLLLNEMRSRSLPQFADLIRPAQDGGADADAQRSSESQWILQARLMMKSKTAVLRDYDAYVDAQIAQAALPPGAYATAPVAAPADPINAYFLGGAPESETREIQEAARARTQDALLCATLALRAYRVEHGAYPMTLNALVDGGYLRHLPVDPFDMAGAPVRYRLLASDRYLLYSIGPDGKDDGGRPIRNALSNPVDSDGDIVAGVTLR